MVEAASRELGTIDILVNNAGIASRGQPVEKTDPLEMERVVRVHAFGPHYLSQLVIPGMKKKKQGDIIMISSAATLYYGAFGAPYNMGKAAMEALALTLFKEVRHHGRSLPTGHLESDQELSLPRAPHVLEEGEWVGVASREGPQIEGSPLVQSDKDAFRIEYLMVTEDVRMPVEQGAQQVRSRPGSGENDEPTRGHGVAEPSKEGAGLETLGHRAQSVDHLEVVRPYQVGGSIVGHRQQIVAASGYRADPVLGELMSLEFAGGQIDPQESPPVA